MGNTTSLRSKPKRRRERLKPMVAKDKKRIVISLHKETIASAKAMLSAMPEVKMTLSDLIEVSLGFFLESALKEVKKRQDERKEHPNAKS